MQAVVILKLRKVRDMASGLFLQTVNLIPGLLLEGSDTKFDISRFRKATSLRVDVAEDLLHLCKKEFGIKHWKEDMRNCDDCTLSDMLTDRYKESKFDVFKDKIMDDIAPSCGMRVLSKYASLANEELTEFVNNMKLKTEWIYLNADSFHVKCESCELQRQGLTKVLDEILPKVLNDRIDAFKEELVALKEEYSREMSLKVEDCAKTLCKDREAIRGYELLNPPDVQCLKQFPYLSEVEGENYWEAKPQEIKELQRELKRYTEDKMVDVHAWWLSQAESLLEKAIEILKKSLGEALCNYCSENIDWIAELNLQKFSLNLGRRLVLPDNDMSVITDVLEKRKVIDINIFV